MREFYLSSHDYGSSPEPRKCTLRGELRDTKGRHILLVDITPPIPKHIYHTITHVTIDDDIHQLGLYICNEGLTVDDIKTSVISVDILYPVIDDQGRFDYKGTFRLGVGGLHATYEEALEDSPIE